MPLFIQASGTVVNISAIGGIMPTPCMGMYGPSKAAVVMVSETMRLELKPLGVKIIKCNGGYGGEQVRGEYARAGDGGRFTVQACGKEHSDGDNAGSGRYGEVSHTSEDVCDEIREQCPWWELWADLDRRREFDRKVVEGLAAEMGSGTFLTWIILTRS